MISSRFLDSLSNITPTFFQGQGSPEVKTATGQRVEILGKVLLEVEINGEQWLFPVYIAENFRYDILLGTDFMIQSNLTIDFVKLLARIGTQYVKILVSPTKNVFDSWRTGVHLLKILSCCEVILNGKVDGWAENEVNILEPNPLESNDRLFTARAIVTVKNGTVPVKFINPWDDSIKLYVAVIKGHIKKFKTGVFAHEKIACGEHTAKNTKEPKFHISDDLSDLDREKLKNLLMAFGYAKRFTHNISMGVSSLVRQIPYRTPQSINEIIDSQVKNMLDPEIIQP